MARVKLTEYDAKRLLISSPNNIYHGFSATPLTTPDELAAHFPEENLVVKVDQGIKKRGKRGLVRVNVTPKEATDAINTWANEGWKHFLVEPVVEHSQEAEHYLSLERSREGWEIAFSEKGGVEVESSWDLVQKIVLPRRGDSSTKELTKDQIGFAKIGGISILELVAPMIPLLDANHISFVEMNPILVRDKSVIPLDMAVEIDDTALNLPAISALGINPVEEEGKSQVERDISLLDSATPASLKFRLINPQGTIWMLLSGGGASLVLADEVADQGMGQILANYGEYSGAPTDDDVYSYTKLILKELLRVKSGKKALVIAAGVANFTDVAKTFKGIIQAMEEVKDQLQNNEVKVFVRRGGPNETKGLKMMEDFLSTAGIPHIIHTHSTPITQVISEVKEYL